MKFCCVLVLFLLMSKSSNANICPIGTYYDNVQQGCVACGEYPKACNAVDPDTRHNCLKSCKTTTFTTKNPTSLRTWDIKRILEIAVPTVVAVLIIIFIAAKIPKIKNWFTQRRSESGNSTNIASTATENEDPPSLKDGEGTPLDLDAQKTSGDHDQFGNLVQ